MVWLVVDVHDTKVLTVEKGVPRVIILSVLRDAKGNPKKLGTRIGKNIARLQDAGKDESTIKHETERLLDILSKMNAFAEYTRMDTKEKIKQALLDGIKEAIPGGFFRGGFGWIAEYLLGLIF